MLCAGGVLKDQATQRADIQHVSGNRLFAGARGHQSAEEWAALFPSRDPDLLGWRGVEMLAELIDKRNGHVEAIRDGGTCSVK